MPRKLSTIAPDWWDYTTLEDDLIRDAAALSPTDLEQLSRPGFRVVMYDTLEDFYLAEALEYIDAWRQATADNPFGICGPIGPTEQLPLVARLVNELGLSLKHAHFWGMDEWVGGDGREGQQLGSPTMHYSVFATLTAAACWVRALLYWNEPFACLLPQIARWRGIHAFATRTENPSRFSEDSSMRTLHAMMGRTLLSAFLSSLNASRRAEPLRLCLLSQHRIARQREGRAARNAATRPFPTSHSARTPKKGQPRRRRDGLGLLGC